MLAESVFVHPKIICVRQEVLVESDIREKLLATEAIDRDVAPIDQRMKGAAGQKRNISLHIRESMHFF